MNKAQLERENEVLRAELEQASTSYFRALHDLAAYQRGELEHLRRENAELKTRVEGEEHE